MANLKGTTKIAHTNVTNKDMDFAAMLLNTELEMSLTDMLKLNKDVKQSVVKCSINDIRFLVSSYYSIQEMRIKIAGQLRAIDANGEYVHISENGSAKAEVLQWLYNNILGCEGEIKKALDKWSASNEVTAWCKQVTGIGPVLACALVAHFDITKADSVSHFHSYAGLNDNNEKWLGRDKATKVVMKHCKNSIVTTDDLIAVANDPDSTRPLSKLIKYAYDEKKDEYTRDQLIKGLSIIPYNAELKRICWLVGESFVKVCNRPKSLYGAIYKERKIIETKHNEDGDYVEQAALALHTKNYSRTTDAYKAYSIGKLPPAHIQARAKRFAVKLFISHLFEEMYRVQYGKPSPKPYVLEHTNHNDYIEPEVPFTR